MCIESFRKVKSQPRNHEMLHAKQRGFGSTSVLFFFSFIYPIHIFFYIVVERNPWHFSHSIRENENVTRRLEKNAPRIRGENDCVFAVVQVSR